MELLQQTGNTLDRPEVRQFIRDEFPDLARELFSSRGLQGGEGPQNAQQFLVANNLIRGLTPGQDDQERGVVFDPDAIVDAVEETTAVIEEALAGSEAGVPDPRPDPLGTFSLTRGEREVLEPYETAVREAENAIEDLTEDSTPQKSLMRIRHLSLHKPICQIYLKALSEQQQKPNVSQGQPQQTQ